MPTATVRSQGTDVDLAYIDEGEGEPVVLVHGFASTKEVNWVETGWVKALTGAGLRVIAADNRGHGGSSKFHDPAQYTLSAMADDTAGLMDVLGIARARLVGYSMGARISAFLASHHGERVERAVLSGNGWNIVEGTGDWNDVRDALLAPSLQDVTGQRGRAFRAFADRTKSDRLALAACVSGVRQTLSQAEMQAIACPVLVAIGTLDDIAGSGERLAQVLTHGEFFAIEGRNHMNAVGDKSHVAAALDFLLRR